MDERSYRIPSQNYPYFISRISALRKRASKLDVPPVTYTAVEETVTDPVTGMVSVYYNVHLEGTTPKLAGWEFIARLVHTDEGNVPMAVPGAEVPARFRSADTWCDHCQTRRQRKDTFLVRQGDLVKQVGSNCLADFLGHRSPDAIARWCEELAGFATDLEGWGGGIATENGVDTLRLLEWTAARVRQFGWVSRRKEQETGTTATVQYARHFFFERCSNPRKCDISIENAKVEVLPEDTELAAAALTWARAIPEDTTEDYLSNLRTVLTASYVTERLAGIAVSGIAAYKRTLPKPEQRPSHHVGTVGQRTEFNLTCQRKSVVDTAFGSTYLYVFEDAEGNVVKMFTSSKLCQEGDAVTLKATVKSHGEYRGRQETLLNRAKVVV